MNPDPTPDPAPDPDLTIVLLGKTGVGKSASGNSILGRTEFESELSFESVTKEITEARGTVFGQRILVVDTPGLLDTDCPENDIKLYCEKLLQSRRRCLFLVVVRVGRFTEEDEKAVNTARRVLRAQGLNKSYLLFTGGDALKGKLLDDFIFADGEGKLPDVVKRFAGRYHLLNNEDEDEEQVGLLLKKSGHLRPQEPPDSSADDSKNQRIMLLGLPGAGKSSSGNSILRRKEFKSDCGFDPVSTETVSASATVEGRQVTVVDTPGFTQEVLSPEKLYMEIMKSVLVASPGPHAFVLVVRIGRISESEIKLFELLPKLFGSEVCNARKYSMVLFTHGDELRGRSIEDLMKTNRSVSDLVSMCGGRYSVFDNKTTKSREQVRSFLNKIDEMVTANGGQHFTNDMFKLAETFINEERNMAGGAGRVAGGAGRVAGGASGVAGGASGVAGGASGVAGGASGVAGCASGVAGGASGVARSVAGGALVVAGCVAVSAGCVAGSAGCVAGCVAGCAVGCALVVVGVILLWPRIEPFFQRLWAEVRGVFLSSLTHQKGYKKLV